MKKEKKKETTEERKQESPLEIKPQARKKNRNKHKEENGQTKQQRTIKISIKQERNWKRPTLNPENQAIQPTQVQYTFQHKFPEPISIPYSNIKGETVKFTTPVEQK